jgi:hypothetical protein
MGLETTSKAIVIEKRLFFISRTIKDMFSCPGMGSLLL